MSEMILKTNLLTKQYKKQKAVDGVSLEIPRGSIFGLIGKNGAGKTTFMRMVGGFAKPTSGEIELMGLTGSELQKGFERVGCLIEDAGILPNNTAYENIKLKAMCKGIYSDEYIKDKLKLVGLDNTGKKPAGKFSLGMRQRLGIALALIGEPDFLMLDEPMNGLDPQGIIEMRELILRVNAEKHTTILISSHILDELSKVATHYAIIHQGCLIEELSTEELYNRCTNRLDIKTTDTTNASVVLEKMGIKSYKVIDNNTIEVYERMDESALINQELVQAGILVSQIMINNKGLEEYFVERTGQ
jgi:ABC-2 type transport system ATP-binding protein